MIRQAQMRVLADAALLQQIEAKLQRALPHRTSTLGKQALSTAVRSAATRARGYGLGDDQLLAYAAFELVFGPEFGRDPRLPWAQRILSNAALTATDKMQRLREAGIFHLAAEAEEAEWAEKHAEETAQEVA